MNARDAAVKLMGRIEQCRVAVRNLDAECQPACRQGGIIADFFDLAQKLNRFACPDRPVSEQPADDFLLHRLPVNLEAVSGQQIRDDIIIITGIKCDFSAAAGFHHGPDHFQALITVERCHFDRDNPFDLRKSPPKIKA
ncbi:hypothetical protein D3C75_824860 [compost metagenome]